MKLKVIRPFLVKGQRQEIGSLFETDDRVFASALIHDGKVERVEGEEQRGPMTTETASGAVPGKAPAKAGKKPTEKAD